MFICIYVHVCIYIYIHIYIYIYIYIYIAGSPACRDLDGRAACSEGAPEESRLQRAPEQNSSRTEQLQKGLQNRAAPEENVKLQRSSKGCTEHRPERTLRPVSCFDSFGFWRYATNVQGIQRKSNGSLRGLHEEPLLRGAPRKAVSLLSVGKDVADRVASGES